MRGGQRTVPNGIAVIGVMLAAVAVALGADVPAAIGPEDVPGLEAWYRIESLHTLHSGDDTVLGWKDSSGRGHHLQVDHRSVKPLFVTQQLGAQPALEVRQGTVLRTFQPFDLDDHTIFVVYRSAIGSRALFRSETDKRRGLILAEENRLFEFQNGDTEMRHAYNEPVRMRDTFSIVALLREDGLLGCYIDGRDVSSGERFSDPLRVGTFFHLEHTENAQSDGQGLYLAEMIFFTRALSDAERAGVTRYLAEKFGLETEGTAPAPEPSEPVTASPSVRLASHTDGDLNVPAFAIPWDEAHVMEPPFSLDPEDATILRCAADAPQVRLEASADLATETAGAQIRLLVLKNGRDYLEAQGLSGPLEAGGGSVTLSAELSCSAGEWFQLIAAGDGAGGPVRLGDEAASLSIVSAAASVAPPAEAANQQAQAN